MNCLLQNFLSPATSQNLLQSYLTKYQTDDPMLPVLGKDLERLHRSLLELIIKPDVLNKIAN